MRNANKYRTVLANAVAIDLAAAHIQMCTAGSLVQTYDVGTAFHHNCVLKQKVFQHTNPVVFSSPCVVLLCTNRCVDDTFSPPANLVICE